MTNVVMKKAVNPDTGQHYLIDLPAPEVVREAILELEYPADGLRVVHATEKLAEKFQLSDEDKRAKNRSDLNVFRYDVVAPQFKRLLREGKLKQPKGSRTPYFLTRVERRETASQPEWPSVEKTVLDPDTGKERRIKLPATRVVKEALLNFNYPPSGIHVRNIGEALADQFELTKEQREAKGKYGLVWQRHVNITSSGLVNSRQLFRIKRGWITNLKQPNIEPSESDESPFLHGDTLSPEVIVKQSHQEIQDRLKTALLERIKNNPPKFFEELVLDLLVEMGYGDSRADAEAVGGSGDGGIDGIIKEDELGLDRIYVQAKRWANNVGVKDIRSFTGALESTGARKGIFITTSDFTKPAKDFVETITSKQIILINSDQLAQFMIKHNVGVLVVDVYEIKQIDLSYFPDIIGYS